MSREDKRRIGREFGHIIIDEAHETGSTCYMDLMWYFKARRINGLTATPERDDGMTPVLKLYIGPIVEVDDLGDFKTRVMLRKTNFFYHFEGKKDKYHKLIEALIHNDNRNQMIIGDILKLTGEGRIVICYSNRIEHMEILEQMAKKAMPTLKTDILASRKYGVSLKIEDQNAIRENLKNLNLHGIFGGKIVEQGFDCPPLEVAIMATPSKSRRLIEQVLGRCQREYPGKKEAIILDYIDEHTKVLLNQFFAKNRRIYKNYHKEYLL
jgi:superfamily II DNA or RNA helicase